MALNLCNTFTAAKIRITFLCSFKYLFQLSQKATREIKALQLKKVLHSDQHLI